ncbi:hypothetical protein [Pedobacter punctiformis]|uniref:Uncharacterized protein n=1 Tax=Pedobacter punctiformis TaxID=3004097 RepID=A0ABT4L6J6_9SPHI|nr:hypothetical protein [Pedobacter sp. HCMS5-2]MCZ4243546.1 hypothetical protein [Pedobacter sp. HCMS5-2]
MQLSIFSTPTNPEPQDRNLSICLIEAAHYVMALNFTDEFSLLYITLNHNERSAKGGFRFVRNGHLKMHPTVYDHLALISISGICAATINTHGLELVTLEHNRFPIDSTLLVMANCEEDYANFKRLVSPISRHFLLSAREVQWSSMLAAFNFFVAPGVWESVQFIANLLITGPEDKLMHPDILTALKVTNNYSALCIAMDQLRALRYPLSKAALKVSITS